MSTAKKHVSIGDALVKARRFCAYQERCHFEVESKLRELGLHHEFIPAICVKLVEEGFLSEERFVSAYVRGKFNQNKWGINKIKIGLQQKHISPKLIELGLAQIETSRYEGELKRLLKLKMQKVKYKNTLELKDKLWKYAIQKGYEANMVSQIVKELTSEL